ncbi:MAG: hypothetical protein HWE10_01775 [Gammaproteobacteria bacterium]|nr:hypothetical protein [Gammaproteobacteria bacterium]
MNDFESHHQLNKPSEDKMLAESKINTFGSLALTFFTITLSLVSFLLVKDEFGVALGLLTPMTIVLTVIGAVIYFKDIS